MSHNHTLSINSISSIIEPTTPPTVANTSSTAASSATKNASANLPTSYHKPGLWDSFNKLNHNLNLPNFNIDQLGMAPGSTVSHPSDPAPIYKSTAFSNSKFAGPHSRQPSVDSDQENKENVATGTNGSVALASTTPRSGQHSRSASVPQSKVSTTKIDKDYLALISKIPLNQLKEEILRLSKDQYGCRFLQKRIDENLIPNYQARLSNFDIIFKEIHPYLYELIIDPFGNYLIQKLINYCNESNLDLILEILQFNLFQISINQHGTRALQKIVDNLNNQHQLDLLTKGLKPYIIELIKDLNGNHVIQKILNKYPPKDCQFIYDSIIEDLIIVATHKHGCCVLQKCLNHVTIPQLQEFSDTILNFKNFQLLINDQFGNYVLQYLISINSWEINYRIFQNFLKFGINNLCNLKFSSNVIEKFLKNSYNNEISDYKFSNLKFELIYNVLISDLNKLINDPYGNYVIQTLIDILIHPQVNYYSKPSILNGSPVLPASPFSVEKLLLVLPKNYSPSNESLQITIIKLWFQNCKIVSSFGKRIQSKINIILNNGSLSSPAVSNQKLKHKDDYYVAPSVPRHQPTPHNFHQQGFQQNMNANGEFIVNENFGAPPNNNNSFNPGYRSLSVSSTPPSDFKFNPNPSVHQASSRNSSISSTYYNKNVNNNFGFANHSQETSNLKLQQNTIMQHMGQIPNALANGTYYSTEHLSNDFSMGLANGGAPSVVDSSYGQGTTNPNFINKGNVGFPMHDINIEFAVQNQQQQQLAYSNMDIPHKHNSSISSITQLTQPPSVNHYTTSPHGFNKGYTPPPNQLQGYQAQPQQGQFQPQYQQQHQLFHNAGSFNGPGHNRSVSSVSSIGQYLSNPNEAYYVGSGSGPNYYPS